MRTARSEDKVLETNPLENVSSRILAKPIGACTKQAKTKIS
jgi:hypothetical protein